VTLPGGQEAHAGAAYLLDTSGPAAPPRDNGELVFAAPWESQAFGVALALHDAGRIDWEDFRQTLIAVISEWEAAHPSGEGWSYYECWLRSLEQLLSSTGLVRADDLRTRLDLLTARPPGHDHHPAAHDHHPAAHDHHPAAHDHHPAAHDHHPAAHDHQLDK
jgi:nitrile hydratase accessory protein